MVLTSSLLMFKEHTFEIKYIIPAAIEFGALSLIILSFSTILQIKLAKLVNSALILSLLQN